MWECPDCSFSENSNETIECVGCGFLLFQPLKLVSEDTGETRTFKLQLELGRGLLKTFAGDDAQYAAEPQFRIFPNSSKEWVLEKIPRLTNPTLHNGVEPTDDQVVLKNNDIISIGSRTSDVQKMKLVAHL